MSILETLNPYFLSQSEITTGYYVSYGNVPVNLFHKRLSNGDFLDALITAGYTEQWNGITFRFKSVSFSETTTFSSGCNPVESKCSTTGLVVERVI